MDIQNISDHSSQEIHKQVTEYDFDKYLLQKVTEYDLDKY